MTPAWMRRLAALWLLCTACLCWAEDIVITGTVLDDRTQQGIALAHVTHANTVRRADDEGRFSVTIPDGTPLPYVISLRAPGYQRQRISLSTRPAHPLSIPLKAIQPKALYLSAYGIGSGQLRGDALRLIEQTELNALVIDVKGDAGVTPYRSAVLQAAGIPQTMVTVADMPAMIRELRARGLYLIARVVVFKDQRLATLNPDWAVRKANGAAWVDGEGLSWIDPSNPQTWTLALAMAQEAAELGFDEIQFDYVRFPDATGLRFSQPNTASMRTHAIAGFLDAARQRLAPYNVFVSADIFGYVCWNTNDTSIGQQLEMLSDRIDYLSPMLYPSGFTWGIPGYPRATESAFEIVDLSLRHALQRSGMDGVRFRPWLQAFRDYAFDHRVFGADEIRTQINAAEKNSSNGWMLWNARNRYGPEGLKPRNGPPPAKP